MGNKQKSETKDIVKEMNDIDSKISNNVNQEEKRKKRRKTLQELLVETTVDKLPILEEWDNLVPVGKEIIDDDYSKCK